MIPEGMRDVLPTEAAELRAIEQTVLARFNAYGYGEVRPPALEYPETIERTGVDCWPRASTSTTSAVARWCCAPT